mmetsp:Transcript_71327/g.82979  ORF Transcript_71327/g.82979 Transcript_71327/m.82979 type:complete len:120 (+) Transcript_71327:42-401(+)
MTNARIKQIFLLLLVLPISILANQAVDLGQNSASAQQQNTIYSCIYACSALPSSSSENYCTSSFITIALSPGVSNPAIQCQQESKDPLSPFGIATDFCVNTRKKCGPPVAANALVTPNT